MIKTWKRQFGSNHIVPDTVFLRTFKTQESYVFSMNIDKTYLRGQYGSTHIAPDKTLPKVIEAIDGNLYIIFVRTITVKQYCPLDQNVLDMLESTTLCEPFEPLIVGKCNIM